MNYCNKILKYLHNPKALYLEQEMNTPEESRIFGEAKYWFKQIIEKTMFVTGMYDTVKKPLKVSEETLAEIRGKVDIMFDNMYPGQEDIVHECIREYLDLIFLLEVRNYELKIHWDNVSKKLEYELMMKKIVDDGLAKIKETTDRHNEFIKSKIAEVERLMKRVDDLKGQIKHLKNLIYVDVSNLVKKNFEKPFSLFYTVPCSYDRRQRNDIEFFESHVERNFKMASWSGYNVIRKNPFYDDIRDPNLRTFSSPENIDLYMEMFSDMILEYMMTENFAEFCQYFDLTEMQILELGGFPMIKYNFALVEPYLKDFNADTFRSSINLLKNPIPEASLKRYAFYCEQAYDINYDKCLEINRSNMSFEDRYFAIIDIVAGFEREKREWYEFIYKKDVERLLKASRGYTFSMFDIKNSIRVLNEYWSYYGAKSLISNLKYFFRELEIMADAYRVVKDKSFVSKITNDMEFWTYAMLKFNKLNYNSYVDSWKQCEKTVENRFLLFSKFDYDKKLAYKFLKIFTDNLKLDYYLSWTNIKSKDMSNYFLGTEGNIEKYQTDLNSILLNDDTEEAFIFNNNKSGIFYFKKTVYQEEIFFLCDFRTNRLSKEEIDEPDSIYIIERLKNKTKDCQKIVRLSTKDIINEPNDVKLNRHPLYLIPMYYQRVTELEYRKNYNPVLTYFLDINNQFITYEILISLNGKKEFGKVQWVFQNSQFNPDQDYSCQHTINLNSVEYQQNFAKGFATVWEPESMSESVSVHSDIKQKKTESGSSEKGFFYIEINEEILEQYHASKRMDKSMKPKENYEKEKQIEKLLNKKTLVGFDVESNIFIEPVSKSIALYKDNVCVLIMIIRERLIKLGMKDTNIDSVLSNTFKEFFLLDWKKSQKSIIESSEEEFLKFLNSFCDRILSNCLKDNIKILLFNNVLYLNRIDGRFIN